MRRWLRRRSAHRSVGPRENQWKGARAESAIAQARQARRTALRQAALAWLRRVTIVAGVAAAGWGLVVGGRAAGPMIERWLEVTTVTVEGIHRIPRQQVLDQLHLGTGNSIVQVETAELKRRLEAHPWVKEATVTRVPLHEVHVVIVERVPAAVLQSGAANYLSDDEGYVLANLGAADEEALPMLTGIDVGKLERGDTGLRQGVKHGIELARLVGNAFEGRLQIDAANPDSLIASVRGVHFQFGQERLSDQWERFQRIKPSLKTLTFDGQGHGPNEVDLRYDQRVIVRERG